MIIYIKTLKRCRRGHPGVYSKAIYINLSLYYNPIMEIKFTVPLVPITKKNHTQFCRNKYTGKTFVIQAPAYRKYEEEFMEVCPDMETIDYPVNVQAIYYMPTKRKVDLINLHAALHDCLVKKGILLDDNCTIVVSTDGSRVYYDKENPRTEITISC